MDADKLRKILRNKKTVLINVRISPELLELLDQTLEKDKEYRSRTEFIEAAILRYLSSKKKI